MSLNPHERKQIEKLLKAALEKDRQIKADEKLRERIIQSLPEQLLPAGRQQTRRIFAKLAVASILVTLIVSSIIMISQPDPAEEFRPTKVIEIVTDSDQFKATKIVIIE